MNITLGPVFTCMSPDRIIVNSVNFSQGIEFRCFFTLCLINILLVRFGLLSGHLLGNSCPLCWISVLIVFCLFVIFIYFPFLVLRAGFGFGLIQFLFIAFLLLLQRLFRFTM